MSVIDLWRVCPQSHVFIRVGDEVVEYRGGAAYSQCRVVNVFATSYPMYKSVIEVSIR